MIGRSRTQPMPTLRGFSLIELMIVIAIIAVLVAIAIPAYSRYEYRARRADGQNILLSIANAQERYYATNNHFGALSDIGYTATPVLSANGFYTVAMVPASASTSQTYTATATPQLAQMNDLCYKLTINSAGKKTPTPASAASSANGSCW